MATTSISKESNGAVKFDFGASLNPLFLVNPTNVTVKADNRASSGTPKTQVPYIIISYNGFGSMEFPYSEIVNINGVAKPATAKEGADLIATEVFSVGGGDGSGVTAADITDSTVIGRAVLTAADLDAARLALGEVVGEIDFVLDGVQTVFDIPHGLGSIPKSFSVSFRDAGNLNFVQSIRTKDATNIRFTCGDAPTVGSQTVYWQAWK